MATWRGGRSGERGGWPAALEGGAGGAALVAAVQAGLLVPMMLAVLGGLPLLLIAPMALVAVCSRDPSRQAAAERILDRLLSALRPREPSAPASRRRKRTDTSET